MYYFAADVHLGLDAETGSAQREKLFIRWLDTAARDAKAIFLVGDIFDFWFEYKRVVPKGFTRLLGKLSEITDNGTAIHFFVGNHDMWAYEYLHEECGLTIHYKPEVCELYGREVFVAHGDNMYLRKPFLEKLMHACFRSKAMKRIFSAVIHPNSMIRFGRWWSEKSRKSHARVHVFCGEKEYLVQYARAYKEAVKNVNVDFFVFGHIHCAHVYKMDENSTAVFLGEWLYNPVYAVLKPDGAMELRRFPSNETIKENTICSNI
ncbi:MAG: UDP-2,3-diacylglucosamine diphosphatase [Rikenellaceae bacterium]|nr:UDP-2,3-diacylglucosamine diphosphatase [Rikenellaceae bacterium]